MIKKGKVRVRHRRYSSSPEERRWRDWLSDVEMFLRELVKGASPDVSPDQIVAKAEALADAFEAMQHRRRPTEVEVD